MSILRYAFASGMKVRTVSVLWHRVPVVQFDEDIIGVDGVAQHKLCLGNA